MLVIKLSTNESYKVQIMKINDLIWLIDSQTCFLKVPIHFQLILLLSLLLYKTWKGWLNYVVTFGENNAFYCPRKFYSIQWNCAQSSRKVRKTILR